MTLGLCPGEQRLGDGLWEPEVNGGKEVVHAVADGRNAAREMIRGWRAG